MACSDKTPSPQHCQCQGKQQWSPQHCKHRTTIYRVAPATAEVSVLVEHLDRIQGLTTNQILRGHVNLTKGPFGKDDHLPTQEHPPRPSTVAWLLCSDCSFLLAEVLCLQQLRRLQGGSPGTPPQAADILHSCGAGGWGGRYLREGHCRNNTSEVLKKP